MGGHEEQAVGERERGDEGKHETRAPGEGGGEGLAGLGELASGGVCGGVGFGVVGVDGVGGRLHGLAGVLIHVHGA